MNNYKVGDKVDVRVLDGDKHFIDDPRHPRLRSIETIMKQSGLGPHDWIYYIEDIEDQKDIWFEVLEINLAVLDDTFRDGNEEEILHDICKDAFPETKRSSSGYFAEEAYIAGAMFRNSHYTVRLHRECGFKDQTHSDYLSYTWELQ
jgi:hypothetical protein